MRTSLSRRRRSKGEAGSTSSISTMPCLLVDDEPSDSSLPSTFPTSQAARRNIRAQLFGMDSNMQPIDTRPSTKAQDSITKIEYRKSGTTDELTALQRAPDTQVNNETPEAGMHNTQRTLSRRTSLFKPGEATRPKTSLSAKRKHQTELVLPVEQSQCSTSSQKLSLELPARPPLERTGTPGDLERAFLGTHTIGSLRITNIITPSPTPRPLEATTCVVSPIEPEKDCFSAVDTNISQTFLEDAQQVASIAISSQFPTLDDCSDEAETHFVMTEDAFENLLQTSPTIMVEAKPRDRSSTVLVGHRRFAQERGNTAELCFEEASVPSSVEHKATTKFAQSRPQEIQAENQSNLHVCQEQPPHHNRGPLLPVPSQEISSNSSPRSASAVPIVSARPVLEPHDSAYGSGASCESSLRSPSPEKTRRNLDDNMLQRTESLNSIYTMYENDSSETVQQHQEGPTVPLTILEQTSLSSSLYAPARTHSYDAATQGFQYPSTNSPPTTITSQHHPRKLQKRRPLPDKPSDNIIVQGRHSNVFRNLPDLPQDIVSAHASRLDNNPGMDHLLETHCKVNRASVGDDLANTDCSIPQIQEIRFPSPTPTEEVDARYLASPPRKSDSNHRPAPPARSRSIFRSMSRSRRKSNITKKEESSQPRNEVLITVASLGDVVGVLGASPYDIAVRSSTDSRSRRSAEGGRQVMQPCQIGYMDNAKGRKSMSAEEATASAMRRSRDRLESNQSPPISPPRRERGRVRYVTPPPPIPQLPVCEMQVLQQLAFSESKVQQQVEPVAASSLTSTTTAVLPSPPTTTTTTSLQATSPPPPPTAWSTSLSNLLARPTTNSAHASTFPSSLASNFNKHPPIHSPIPIPIPPAYRQVTTRPISSSIPAQHRMHTKLIDADVTETGAEAATEAETEAFSIQQSIKTTPVPRLPSLELGKDIDFAEDWGF